jgi:acetylornithine deacetylase/succinyl-diaminopimelate desuccinylase-like protein
MKKLLFRLCPALLFAAPISAQQTPRAVDWDAITREATEILAEYLRIDTSNPPGNELAGAQFLQRVLAREGIEAQILDEDVLGPGRANLYARVRGDGSKRAVALVHHIDVVPASPEYWTVPPFSGEIRDGYLWGRGALDNKGEGIMYLLAMVALKRSGVPLTRDLVYIANADEELGSTGGIAFVERHADLLAEVEYLITEATENGVIGDSLLYFAVGVAEKRTFWQRLTTYGIPSHGSKPTPHNPVPRLVRAVERLAAFETPLHVTPGVDKFFRDISVLYPEPRRSWLHDIRNGLTDSAGRAWVLSNVEWNAYLRNTITPTVLRGSAKTNVIPPEAMAEIDVRLLPDQDPDSVLRVLQAVVADTAVHFSTILQPKAPLESPLDSDVVRAVERAARDRRPGVLVTTPLQTGATDRPTYQRLGIKTYAIDPFLVDAQEAQRGTHGNNERVSLENIEFGVRFVYDILRYLQ